MVKRLSTSRGASEVGLPTFIDIQTNGYREERIEQKYEYFSHIRLFAACHNKRRLVPRNGWIRLLK